MNDTLKFYINFLTNKYNKRQLNRKELCQELDISLSTLNNLINNDQLLIRYKRIGTSQKARFMFPIIEVANFLSFNNKLIA